MASFYRCKLIEYLGNNRATFECHEGHHFKTTVFPKAPNGKVPDGAFIRRFTRYWQSTGVVMDCPKCKREANAHVAQPFRRIVNGLMVS